MLNLGRLLWWKLFGWLVGCGCGKHYVMIPRAEGDDQPLLRTGPSYGYGYRSSASERTMITLGLRSTPKLR